VISPPPAVRAGTLRLADVPRRARVVVERLRADPAVAERLHSVGIGVGAEVLVLRAGMRPTVRVGSARLALGPDLSRAIEVRAAALPA
jgi:Fe2+ transport system protein FeoA